MHDEFLRPGRFVESADPEGVAFAGAGPDGDPVRVAIDLYYAVRDAVIYNPYQQYARPEAYSGRQALLRREGFCMSKAALLAACARARGIPARLGFADVRNHLATPRLLELNGDDVFRWHAWTELLLEGRWVKATPAFNIELCQRFGVLPLEFDGRSDSVFHPFDAQNRRHMEYVRERGSYADVPLDEILATLRETSPKLLEGEDVDDMFKPGVR